MFSVKGDLRTYLISYIYLLMWHTISNVNLTMYFPTHILPAGDINYLKCSSDFYMVSLVRSSTQLLSYLQFWKEKKPPKTYEYTLEYVCI